MLPGLNLKLSSLFSLALFTLVSVVCFSQNDKAVEKRIIDYLKTHMKPGEPVLITNLYNQVFTSPEERKVLDRLYNIFFKVPAFIAQYYATSQKPPTLQEISQQFNLPIEGEADVILKIIEYDRRVPKFITRDPKTGEITQVDIEKVKADPRFNKVIERSITGWEDKMAAPFTVQSLDGKEISLDSFKGKTRLLYFWFTHCPPCVQITPHLVSLQARLKSNDFVVIGLNADKVLELDYDEAERKAYRAKNKINFPVGHLTTELQSAYGGVQLFPTLFLIDQDGRIRKHFVNYQDETTLRKAVESVLQSSSKD